mgnify:CR=1 FL=1
MITRTDRRPARGAAPGADGPGTRGIDPWLLAAVQASGAHGQITVVHTGPRNDSFETMVRCFLSQRIGIVARPAGSGHCGSRGGGVRVAHRKLSGSNWIQGRRRGTQARGRTWPTSPKNSIAAAPSTYASV